MKPQIRFRGFRLQAEGTKLAIALLALVALTAQAPRPSPFVSALDEIAQRQLKARATTIAGIKDTAAAQAALPAPTTMTSYSMIRTPV